MGLDAKTAISWTTLEEVLDRLEARNAKMRIINESLHVSIRGADPKYCWDGAGERYVYVRKQDWLKASPAIRTVEACVILRITPAWFKKRKNELGIEGKRSIPGKVAGVKRQGPMVYYSVEDIIQIARSLTSSGKGRNHAGEEEVRRLFSKGYVSYKLARSGEFVPVWDESIF